MIRVRNKETMQQKKRSYSDELKSEARMEREIPKKQPRTSPRNRCPVRVYESAANRARLGDPSVADLAAENQ